MAKKNQAVRNTSAPLPAWVWLLTGFAAGIALSAILIFRDWSKDSANANTPKPAPAASVAEMSRGEEERPDEPVKPKYDFYTALAEREVVIPDNEIRAQAEARREAPEANVRFFLQLGSFPDAGGADALKAQLALSGVQVTVSEVTVNGKTWHRVRRGPFKQLEEADTAKRDLMQGNVSSTLVKESTP
jgi:cell division protein FtsN